MSQNRETAISRLWVLLILPIIAALAANWIWERLSGFNFLQTLFNQMFLFMFNENERVAKAFEDGTKYTFVLSFFSCLFGTIIGCATAWLLRYTREKQHIVWYSAARYILLNIALTVPLYMMLYFGWFSPIWFSPTISRIFGPEIVAVIMLSLNLSFFVTKIVLGGFQVLPTDQIEAARVCGFSNSDVVMKFEIPLLWNAIGNALIVEWTTTIKLTSFVGVIGVYDLMQAVMEEVQYSPALASKIYLNATLIYMALIFPLLLIAETPEIMKLLKSLKKNHRDGD